MKNRTLTNNEYVEKIVRKVRKIRNTASRFHVGDVVRIDNELPKCMSHFPAGQFAIVETAEKGGLYELWLGRDMRTVAWYPEEVLTGMGEDYAKHRQ